MKKYMMTKWKYTSTARLKRTAPTMKVGASAFIEIMRSYRFICMQRQFLQNAG